MATGRVIPPGGAGCCGDPYCKWTDLGSNLFSRGDTLFSNA